MKNTVQLPILVLLLLLTAPIFAQQLQQDYINYQGVALDADGNAMADEKIKIDIKLRFGAPNATVVYNEDHKTRTDASGVFSIRIGKGANVGGTPYEAVDWSTRLAPYITISIKGTEVGTTELLAVPYAIRSGDKQFAGSGDNNIRNLNSGNVGIGTGIPTAKLQITKDYNVNPFLTLESKSGDRANLRFAKKGSTSFWDQIAGIRTDDASGTMSYYYNSNHVMTLRGDKKVGINTFNPKATLDVDGDVNTSGEVHTNKTGNTNMLPIAYGTISPTGAVENGSGNFTVSSSGRGIYLITINGENLSYGTATVSTTLSVNGFGFISNIITEENKIVVYTGNSSARGENRRFTFLVYKP